MISNRAKVVLRGAGVALREMKALDVQPIHSFDVPYSGFGLTGKTGLGKTWALVQFFGAVVDEIVGDGPNSRECVPARFSFWVNWPDQAECLKRMVSGNGDGQDLNEFIERAQTCQYLFLDDLGQERIKGAEDYSLGVLKEIIDHRHRNDLPLFWTSNLTVPQLANLYGSRIVSRMMEAWPPVQVQGKDLRLSGMAVSQ